MSSCCDKGAAGGLSSRLAQRSSRTSVLCSIRVPTGNRQGRQAGLRRPFSSVRMNASSEDVPSTVASAPVVVPNTDPFVLAWQRLQSLLAGVGDGEDELVDSMVSSESPEVRLQTQLALAGILALVSCFIAKLTGHDPFGGPLLSLDQLSAAGVGAAMTAPLVGLRFWLWSSSAAKALPSVEDMHLAQLELLNPWLTRCSPWHVASMVALEVIPSTLLLLPAAQGGLLASVAMYQSSLSSAGLGPEHLPYSDPGDMIRFTCLLFTGVIAGMGKGLELGVSDPEYKVVTQAVDNADRYYRATSMEMGSRPSDAAHSALAFRSVAKAWLLSRSDAALTAAGLCCADVLALGGMWYTAGGLLAAPVVGALALNAVDYYHWHQAVLRREMKVAAHSRSAKDKSGGEKGRGGDQRI